MAGKRQERPPYASADARKATYSGVWTPFFRKASREASKPSDLNPPFPTPFGGMSGEERRVMGARLAKSLEHNLKTVRGIFHSPRNADLVVRQFKIRTGKGWTGAAIVFMAGLVDRDAIRLHLLLPLMNYARAGAAISASAQSLAERSISQLQVRTLTVYSHIASSVVEGECVLLVDGDDSAVAFETRFPEHRPISESPTEAVVRGPHTGLIENLTVNIGLIRTNLPSPDLVSERYYVGARGHMVLGIMYLEGVVNPKLVDEVRKRIASVRADALITLTAFIHLIQDSPLDPYPSYIATERPDMVASMVAEGHVAILGCSPTAILVPAPVWSLMHSSEDYYIHFVPASAIRILRWLALISTTYASALYVAVVSYHPSMLPTELLFAMAAAREAVPFPSSVEVLGMEVVFELLREAVIRIPSVIGPTIGIVGAVLLGQAAVQASIVSPILIVVVAISGLGAFAIPNYNLSLYARLLKFVMIVSAALLGIPGLTFATLALLAHIFSLRSFGVPVTAPLFPNWPHSPDLILKGPPGSMKNRPGHTRPLDIQRIKKSDPLAEGGDSQK